jgi:hypothetical protein
MHVDIPNSMVADSIETFNSLCPLDHILTYITGTEKVGVV